MASNQDTTSRQASERGVDINLVDIFFYLLRFWYIYVLSIGLVLAFALYRMARQPYVYETMVKVFIKDATQRSMVDADMMRYMRNVRLNMDNEMLQISSRQVLERAVRMVNANVFYQAPSGLRTIELYDTAPFAIHFLDSLEREARYQVSYKDTQHILLSVEGQKGEHEIPLNLPVQLGSVRFIVEPRANFASPWQHEVITVERYPISDIARYYQHTIEVTQAESKASSLTLSLRDHTKSRALDILKAQVAAYNQEEVELRGQLHQ